MRPSPQPALIPGEYCGACPLPCEQERNSGDACTASRGARYGVHPSNPDVMWQWLDWASSPARVAHALPPPALPAYVPVLKKEVTVAEVREIPSAAIGFTVSEFLGVAARAKREGVSVRELLGASGRRIVVVGADDDRANRRRWEEWGSTRERIVQQAPDLVVPPDLSIYDDEDPGTAILHFQAHTKMHATLAEDGTCSVPPFGFARASDIERFAAWARENEVAGAFLDLQNRKPSKVLEIAADLRRCRSLFPAGFAWIVHGLAQPPLWRELREALGVTIFSGSGAWEEARLRRHFVAVGDDLVRVASDASFAATLAANIEVLQAAASRVVLPTAKGAEFVVEQLSLFAPDHHGASRRPVREVRERRDSAGRACLR